MQKTYKGVSKILLIVLVGIIIVISAVMFGYGGEEVQDVKDDVQDKAQDVISEASDDMVSKVVEEGQEVIGKKLKETGEKMLEEDVKPGYYGEYGDDGVGEYEKVILFFTAPWCPSCVEAEKNIEIDKKDIPTDVAIVKVDFDNDVELREKYGINKQHTFVLVGNDDVDDVKWDGSITLSEVIDNIE